MRNVCMSIDVPYALKDTLKSFYLVCFLVLFSFVGCGSQPIIHVPPSPKWVSGQIDHWNPKIPHVLFARGKVSRLSSISQRRTLAEAAAVEHAKNYILKIAKTDHDLLSKLPWTELSQVDKRFFDAPNNTQYTLIKITLAQCQRWIQKYSGYPAQKQERLNDVLKILFNTSSTSSTSVP